MNKRIAIVGLACRYPDASSPARLWENVLAGRRAFRRIPDERMNHADYWSPDPTAPDRFYAAKAAVLEGYEFDRVRYRIAGSTYRSTDLTHWLALDVATQAMADAGYPDGAGLPRETTGVVVGNSLTGEFSRASVMRLRWPYVRRVVAAALLEDGLDEDRVGGLLSKLELQYKSPFPPIDEDTLAGGLSNTIAGRICNYYDLKGGGYTVDAACASSVLSVITACRGLSNGDLDVAVAGGVDLSIDPFEVIGFAKTGALATGEMRVFDRGSNGFWPGEGCGMAVLMRESDALAENRPVYALIAGWGVSSDGKGGITRPEASGHELAVQRAYELAGFGVDTVGYFEGHGTGTAVGDTTELRALSNARRMANPSAPPAAIGTIKGNIGHTKAAAGIAGVIKAALTVQYRTIPPATSHRETHPELDGDRPALRVPGAPEEWPEGPVRVGVSSMGFGGINTHLVLEDPAQHQRPGALGTPALRVAAVRQDAELLLFDAADATDLREQVTAVADRVPALAYAELADLAAELQRRLLGRPVRAAVVCDSPDEAERRLGDLVKLIDDGAERIIRTADGVFLGPVTNPAVAGRPPAIGFLFPGQGSGRGSDGGALRQRFATADQLYRKVGLPTGGDQVATAIAQPRIVTASVAGLRVLAQLGITGDVAVGHSLGELTALHWAGAMEEATLLRTSAERGRVMAEASHDGGTMASIAAPASDVEPLLAEGPVVIAGYNSPFQTVISGAVDAVARVGRAAQAKGLTVTRIAVSHAFHSLLVEPAAHRLAEFLAGQRFQSLTGRVMSTVTGGELAPDTDVRELLRAQVLEPVRFADAVERAAAGADLFIEVGPGRVLERLAAEVTPGLPGVSLDVGGPSLAGLLGAVGAAYALGVPVRHAALFGDRLARPLRLDEAPRFLASPCELAPDLQVAQEPAAEAASPAVTAGAADSSQDTLGVLLTLAAERAELPPSAVSADSLPLDQLHLSSISVGQIMNDAARALGLPPPTVSTNFATATMRELAASLDELAETGRPGDTDRAAVAGVAGWARPFAVSWETAPRPVPVATGEPVVPGEWLVVAPADHLLAGPLRDRLERAGIGGGVLLCLPPDSGEEQVAELLRAAHAALAAAGPTRFAVVQHGRGASGLAKTLHLEAPGIPTCVVDIPPAAGEPGPLADLVAAEVAATTGFTEVRYDEAGARLVPVLRLLTPAARDGSEPSLGPDDVLLVTGGGKGITVESALAIARRYEVRLGLLGRSDPAADADLAANLDRLTGAGVRFRYLRADVTDEASLAAAVAELERELGPVTAVLHGAGRNEPTALSNLDEARFARTLAPKLAGLRAVLAAVDPDKLRLLVTFGSIIGRAGLRGEADYAVANDWLTGLTQEFAQEHPACRCLAMEWSVWSGTGMGERLGVLEALVRDGITPIPTDVGIDLLLRLLDDPGTPVVTVISGRAQGMSTLDWASTELPLLRFVEQPRVHYPGIELVADAELSPATDPYLEDHLLDGAMLFPAVVGMEAMAQVAASVSGHTGVPVLEDVEFLRPVVVQPGGATQIRVATLVRDGHTVEAVIRSSETDFQADHFRAVLRYPRPEPVGTRPEPGPDQPPVALDPLRQLYGGMLFQGKRFQRLLRYQRLAATYCEAEIALTQAAPWFGMFLPPETLLGDIGARDAFMHSIQSCVPNATLLPVGVEKLYPSARNAAGSPDEGQVRMYATERSRTGDTYLYDVDVRDEAGELVERWEGLRLQAVRKQDGSGPWLPALLGPYLERRLPEVAPVSPVAVVVEPDQPGAGERVAARRAGTALALGRALGRDLAVRYRPDGKPEVDGAAVSSSHGAGVTFVATADGDGPVGCDVQLVPDRPAADDWAGLLGTHSDLPAAVVRETGEAYPVAAARVWSAIECVQKSGRAITDPVSLQQRTPDGWVMFALGESTVATFVTHLVDTEEPVVFAILTQRRR